MLRVMFVLILVACAPVTTSLHTTETVDRRHEDIGKPTSTTKAAALDLDGDALRINLTERDTCEIHAIEDFHRVEYRDRSVNKPITVIEFVLGFALAGAGGYALADPAGAQSAAHGAVTLDNSQTKIAGVATASVGALAVVFGIVSSTRGGSSTKTLPHESRTIGAPRTSPCGERPVINTPLVIVAGNRTVALSPTDAAGAIATPWDSLSSQLFEGAAPPTHAELHIGTASGPVLSDFDLIAPRAATIKRAWAAADKAGTARAAVAFRVRFPDERRGDVQAKINATGDVEMDEAVAAAVAANNLGAARSLLNEWNAIGLVKSERHAAREAAVTDREREDRVVALTTGIDVALVAASNPSDLAALNRAVALSVELAATAPTDPRAITAQANVLAARKAHQKILFDSEAASEKKGELPEAIKLADLAVEALPDDPKAQKQRTEIRKRVARRYASDARTKMQAKNFNAASDLLSKAEAISKDDREVAYTRKSVTAAQAAAEAAIADTEERERRKAERLNQEAASQAQREAERQKQEADRLAREQDRKTKTEEARAARETEAKQREAERLTKLEERKHKEDELRAARDADKLSKAEADKLAKTEAERKKQEAAAKVDAERKQDEANKLARADLERRKQQARKKEAGKPASRVDEIMSDARTSTALVGVWAAVGRASGNQVTLIFNAASSGSGQVTMLGASGRLLGREQIKWQLAGGGIVIEGGAHFAMRGAATLRGDSLSWAGYHWKRVRARTTLTAAAIPAQAKPADKP